MTDTTYQMSETLQWTTLAIAIGVTVIVVMCFRSMLWDPWTRQWSIDDAEASIDELTADYCSGRDQHGVAERDAMVALRGGR